VPFAVIFALVHTTHLFAAVAQGKTKGGAKRGRDVEDKKATREESKSRKQQAQEDAAAAATAAQRAAAAANTSSDEESDDDNDGGGLVTISARDVGASSAPAAAAAGAPTLGSAEQPTEHVDERDGMLPGESFAQFESRLKLQAREREDERKAGVKRRATMRPSRVAFYERKAQEKAFKAEDRIDAAHRAQLRTEGREDYASDEEALGRSLRDDVKFGERVERPPDLKSRPRKVGPGTTPAAKSAPAGARMLHFMERLGRGDGVSRPSSAPAAGDDARDAAVDEYRKIKARNAEMKRVAERAAAKTAAAAAKKAAAAGGVAAAAASGAATTAGAKQKKTKQLAYAAPRLGGIDTV